MTSKTVFNQGQIHLTRGSVAGTLGPRLGVIAGEKSLVSRICVRAFEMGMEARLFLYPAATRSLAGSTPERVQELVETTCTVSVAL